MGNRMSSLPIARHCSASAVLADRHSAGRAAVISSAYHALWAGDDSLLSRLTPDEREQVMSWSKPAPCMVGGEELRYEDATTEKELTLRFDEGGQSVGHADMIWHSRDDLVLVGDAKLTRFTSSLDSLQLHAYGWAAAVEYGVTRYQLGIWVIEDEEWIWGPVVDIEAFDFALIAEEVWLAATNTDGAFTMGAHCHDCYGRRHCQEWLLPISDPESALAPFAQTGAMSPLDAVRAIHVVKAAEDAIKVVKSNLRAFADQTGGIFDPETEQIWKASPRKGSPKLDKERLEQDHPGLLEKYTSRGPDTKQYRWLKTRKKEGTK